MKRVIPAISDSQQEPIPQPKKPVMIPRLIRLFELIQYEQDLVKIDDSLGTLSQLCKDAFLYILDKLDIKAKLALVLVNRKFNKIIFDFLTKHTLGIWYEEGAELIDLNSLLNEYKIL
jgi:hypothetical protein